MSLRVVPPSHRVPGYFLHLYCQIVDRGCGLPLVTHCARVPGEAGGLVSLLSYVSYCHATARVPGEGGGLVSLFSYVSYCHATARVPGQGGGLVSLFSYVSITVQQ